MLIFAWEGSGTLQGHGGTLIESDCVGLYVNSFALSNHSRK